MGSLGAHFGTIRIALEFLRPPETPSQADGSQVPRLRTKIDPLAFAYGSRRNGPRTTVQTLRSTRAGGQDDVSFTNSLKLHDVYFFDVDSGVL